MPLEVFSGKQALDNFRANSRSGWPKRDRDANRLRPVALPWYTPSFAIEPDDSIFTIGSCFARNIEDHLADLGFDVPTRPVSYDLPEDYTDKYATPSILNEFRWALDADATPPTGHGFYQIGDDAWHDPYANPSATAQLEVITERRRILTETTKRIGACRIIILTLGLVEVWRDEQSGEYINRLPPMNFVKRNAERFSLHILDHQDIIESLADIHGLLSRFGHPDFRILATVSPVPMVTTFTDRDVLVANMYSKSVLRAATEQFTHDFDNVDYFPSFESVMLSPRDVAWERDNRHVTPEVIGVNVSRMIQAYAPRLAELDFEHYFQAGQASLRAHAFAEAERALAQAVNLDPGFAGAHHALGVALVKMDKHERAEAALHKAIALQPGKPAAESWFQLGLLYFHTDKAEKAVEMMRESVRLQPRWAATHFHLGEVFDSLGRLEEAAAAMQKSIDLSPGHANIHFCLGGILEKLGNADQAAAQLRRAAELDQRYAR